MNLSTSAVTCLPTYRELGDSEHIEILYAEYSSVGLCAVLFTFYESFLKLVYHPRLWQP